jgi:hypothetical protein
MTTFYYQSGKPGSEHDHFATLATNMPTPDFIRITFFGFMTEPTVEMWHRVPEGACSDPYAPQYQFTGINGAGLYRPAGLTDEEWGANLGDMEVHTFSRGSANHPDGGRYAEACAWAVRYGWVES